MDDLEFAKNLLEIGDQEGAVKELSRLLRNDTKNIPAWLLLAQVVTDEKKKADCYRQVLRNDPKNQVARIELMKWLVKPDQPQENPNDKSLKPRQIENKPIITNQVEDWQPSKTRKSEQTVTTTRTPTPGHSYVTQKQYTYAPSKQSTGCTLIVIIIFICIAVSVVNAIIDSVNKSSSHSTTDPQGQAAIQAVKNQHSLVAGSMIESVAVVLVLLEKDGHTTSIDGWYYSKGDGYYSVYIYFYLDGKKENGEWRYYPSGKIVPQNDWAYAFMGQ